MAIDLADQKKTKALGRPDVSMHFKTACGWHSLEDRA
jgi:hypothetical protein